MKPPRRTDWNEIYRRLERSRQAMDDIDAENRAQHEDILRRRAAELATAVDPTTPAVNAAEGIEALVFEIAGERYAFDAAYVGTVIAMAPLTPLPGVPDHVVGIVALQGGVLSVVDLRSLLDLPLARLAEPTAIIVLRSADMEFGVLAEAIGGIVRYRLDALQRDVPGLMEGRHAWLHGIAVDRTIVLDAAGLLADPRLIVEND